MSEVRRGGVGCRGTNRPAREGGKWEGQRKWRGRDGCRGRGGTIDRDERERGCAKRRTYERGQRGGGRGSKLSTVERPAWVRAAQRTVDGL